MLIEELRLVYEALRYSTPYHSTEAIERHAHARDLIMREIKTLEELVSEFVDKGV